MDSDGAAIGTASPLMASSQRATLEALNVPLKHRVRQLELALGRLRWLPDLDARPITAINIPMFRLWARDPTAPADALVGMGSWSDAR